MSAIVSDERLEELIREAQISCSHEAVSDWDRDELDALSELRQLRRILAGVEKLVRDDDAGDAVLNVYWACSCRQFGITRTDVYGTYQTHSVSAPTLADALGKLVETGE